MRDRLLDDTLGFGRRALDDGPIGLADRARCEQRHELPQRLRMAAEHETAAGVAIEPMRERRRRLEPEGQGGQQRLQIGTRPGGAMHGDAGRLVQHQHVGIPIEYALCQRFRRHLLPLVPVLPKL